MTKHPRTDKPIECQACHKIIEVGHIFVRHHVTYFPETIVNVHRSCHSRIHVGKTMYQELRPDPRQTLRWYKKLNSNYVYHTYASDWSVIRFFMLIEFGFLTPQKMEEMRELEVKQYWDEVDRIQKIRDKLQIKQTWSSSDILTILSILVGVFFG